MTRDAAMNIRDLPTRLFHWAQGASCVSTFMQAEAISFYVLNLVQKRVAPVACVIATALPRLGA